MKRQTKRGVVIALVVSAIAGWGVWRYVFPIVMLVYVMHSQVTAGQKYMDSLTEKDIQIWTDRTENILSGYEPNDHSIGVYGMGGRPIQPELRKLKILRVDIVDKNQVRYVWAGGMDHTELEVDRLNDGSFKFIAHYDDGKDEKIIWPKE